MRQHKRKNLLPWEERAREPQESQRETGEPQESHRRAREPQESHKRAREPQESMILLFLRYVFDTCKHRTCTPTRSTFYHVRESLKPKFIEERRTTAERHARASRGVVSLCGCCSSFILQSRVYLQGSIYPHTLINQVRAV